MAEAMVRFGDNSVSAKQGINPSFFARGESFRHGTEWPACGEVDILQTINGELKSFGAAHCDVYPGGRCDEPKGLAGTVEVPDQGWQRWRVVWDRMPGGWECESVTWYLGEEEFHRVEGGRVGDEGVWETLVGRELFFVLDVAVGRDWVSRFSFCFVPCWVWCGLVWVLTLG